MNKQDVIKVLIVISTILSAVGILMVIDSYNIHDRVLSDRRYMVGLDIQTDIKYDNTTFLVYDGDVLVESDNVSRTIFREDTKDYQYTCYCDRKNWTYAEASTFRFIWYDVDNDEAIIDIMATPMDWSDSYGYGNYFIWLDRNEQSSIIMARIF